MRYLSRRLEKGDVLMGVSYQINKRSISKILNWRGENVLLCYRCGEEISAGDWVRKSGRVSKVSTRTHMTWHLAKVYHLSCYEGMFLDV